MVDIVTWDSAEAPAKEDYPFGGVFCLAADCLGIGGSAKKGTLWRMTTLAGGGGDWEKITRYPLI